MKTLMTLLLLLPFGASAFEWPRSTPESQGLDSQVLSQMDQLIQSQQYGNIRSLLVIKNGVLVHETYFGNQGEKRPIYSVTKSVGNVLLGIAQHQGHTLDVNASAFQYMPQYNNVPFAQAKQAITVHDLLTQRHGLEWDEWTDPYNHPNNSVYKMLRTNDWYHYVMSRPLIESPDSNFTYSTGASSMMSIILQNISGESSYPFAIEHLFTPLGINDHHWELIDGGGQQGQGITTFPHDLAPLGFGIWLKPIDMAKIGQLYLNGGTWEGERLVAQEWIDQSIIPYSDLHSDPDVFTLPGSGYGYQWWTHDFNDDAGRIHHSYYADGYGRQYIFVFPDHDLIVTTTADDYFRDGQGMGTLLREVFLPSLTLADETVPITNDLNGSWFDPEQAGQGVNIEVLNQGQTLWGYWYTYQPGGGQQRWFTLQGNIEGDTATFSIYSTEGGVFLDPQAPQVTEWGTGQMQFSGCESGTFTFSSTTEQVSGTIPLTRLTTAGNCTQTKNKKSKERILVP